MKILLLSHNSLGSSTNMGITARSLLKGFNDDELCQIFIRGDVGERPKVSSLFLSEKLLIKSIITRKSYWVNPERDLEGKENNRSVSISVKKRNVNKLIVREAIWKLGKWKSKNLDAWLIDQSPKVIFLMPGDSAFIYSLAEYLSKKFSIPVVCYFGDDYTSSFYGKGMLSDWYQKIILNKIREIVNISSGLIYISEGMNNRYNKLFNKKGITVMTPYEKKMKNKEIFSAKRMVVSYIGNLESGRLDTMLAVADEITKINKIYNCFDFRIFAPNTRLEEAGKLNKDYEYYKGEISPSEVKWEIDQSDILLHIETFDSDVVDSIKYSFSTKIASYLASGRLIIGYGPIDVNSMDYLKNNQLALIANDIEMFKEHLLSLATGNIEEIKSLINNAAKISEINHNPIKNAKRVKDYIVESVGD